jgi:hypothetical protein
MKGRELVPYEAYSNNLNFEIERIQSDVERNVKLAGEYKKQAIISILGTFAATIIISSFNK